jgi:hypothetical protein
MKSASPQKQVKEQVLVEHKWFAAMRDVSSPYWSARLGYQISAKSPVRVVNGWARKVGKVS